MITSTSAGRHLVFDAFLATSTALSLAMAAVNGYAAWTSAKSGEFHREFMTASEVIFGCAFVVGPAAAWGARARRRFLFAAAIICLPLVLLGLWLVMGTLTGVILSDF